MSENLIIFNARIVTPIGFSARKGEEMSQLQIIENGTVEVTKGIITYVGENRGEDRDGYYSTIGIITLAGIAFYPVSSTPIPILYLAENVPKNYPGV